MNHPIEPLRMIMGDMAKKSEARNPAVVPPIVLTSAKITTVVSELITTGNHMVKSYRLVPMPKFGKVLH